MANTNTTVSAMIIGIALSMTFYADCLASEKEQDINVKVLLLYSETIQSDLHERLAAELLLALENVSLVQRVIDPDERHEWGDKNDRVMRKIYALGLLEDAQVVIELNANHNQKPQLLFMVLFEQFAVGTVENLDDLSDRPEELALFCHALMIEARDLFERGSLAEADLHGSQLGRWIQFSVLSDLPKEPEPVPEDKAPQVNIEPTSIAVERPFTLIPHFAFETGVVGQKGSSIWIGGGLQFQWTVTQHWVLLGTVAAKGGAVPHSVDNSVEGFKIDPSIGTAGRWVAGPVQFMLTAELLASFSRTTYSGEGLQSTSSFHFAPGLRGGLMVRWQLSEQWSICLAGGLNWYWKRWGYKNSEQNDELFNTPWLELSSLVGVGYHF